MTRKTKIVRGTKAEAARISALPTMEAQKIALRGHLSGLTAEARQVYAARLRAGEANVSHPDAVAVMLELIAEVDAEAAAKESE